jgi:hypothetical protein
MTLVSGHIAYESALTGPDHVRFPQSTDFWASASRHVDVATRFPNATPQVRMELNRRWSIEMLRRAG